MYRIQERLEKVALPGLDIEYHIERLFAFPEGEWFQPANGGDHSDYSICNFLHNLMLIARKDVPVMHDGQFRGWKTSFLYHKDLNYENL